MGKFLRGGAYSEIVIHMHNEKDVAAVTYHHIISLENLYGAWKEFVSGKKCKQDVAEFSFDLSHNISLLHEDLKNKTYRHGGYQAFNVSDPKPRNIHKAVVRDRLVHHALYRILYPFFDKTFIADSYSCRTDKGTHKALRRFQAFAYKVGRNNTKTCWILKCDIKKFFAAIDQAVLSDILRKYIPDQDILWLLSEIMGSFHSTRSGVGLPLGNLTSQLLVNIYMNEFDQFVKHRLKARRYIRYADDFAVLSRDKGWLQDVLLQMRSFLLLELKLEMHPDKVFIRTLASGVDFLGWTHFPDYRVLRTATKRRMLRNLGAKGSEKEAIQSYLGLLKHGNAWKLRNEIEARDVAS
jgi:RNA-directed DNA polymerase